MSSTSLAWLLLLFLPLCLHSVCSEKLQFLSIPPKREVLSVGANLTINCTTNSQTAQTNVYYRRRLKSTKWKEIKPIPGKVIQDGSVFTLMAISRNNKGQYQCRAWGSTNRTETTWPENVGKIFVRGGPNKAGSNSKVQENRKPVTQKPLQKKPKQKKPKRKRKGKPDKKKNICKERPGHKRKGSRKPGRKRSGHKRGGSKRPGRKQTEAKRPCTKSPALKKLPKQLPEVKVGNNSVSVNESSMAVLKCTVRVQGGDEPLIRWYRSKKMIGCSDKKILRCSLTSRRYLVTFKVRTKAKNRKKYTSYLRIPKTRRARDQNSYVCMASNSQGSARQIIRLMINKP